MGPAIPITALPIYDKDIKNPIFLPLAAITHGNMIGSWENIK